MNISLKYKQKNQYFILMLLFFLFTCVSAFSKHAMAEDATCAEVKIVIEQKLLFERQAFDARMIINNGLTDMMLENIRVDLIFTDKNNQQVIATQDSNNEDENIKFFYKIDSLDNIDSIDGNGNINTKTNAEIHWLIIPAFGAASYEDTFYNIGAKISYTLNGKETIVDVSPDYVMVRPQPLLTLDYFMPIDVYGDDPFTDEVEPSIPFTLGLRIKNEGYGTSYKTTIESAQPKIIEDQQQLPIEFTILSSHVNDKLTGKSLLLDFGNIESQQSKVARWDMITSLSGKFVEFDATFTHADTLGGAVTSLLKAVNYHQLIQNVRVDADNRDKLIDFLALDGDVIRVYESEGFHTEVSDQSANAELRSIDRETKLVFPETKGLVYVKITDPSSGKQKLNNVIRSDGKVLPIENIWQSKTRNEDLSWSYFINLFDNDSTGNYSLYENRPNDMQSYNINVQKGNNYSLNELLPKNYYFEANKPYLLKFIIDSKVNRTCSGKKNFDNKTKRCQNAIDRNYDYNFEIFTPLKSGILHNDLTFTGSFYLKAKKAETINAIVTPLDINNSLTKTTTVLKGSRYSLNELLPTNYIFEANKSYFIYFSGEVANSRYCSNNKIFDIKSKTCIANAKSNYIFKSNIFTPLETNDTNNDAFEGNFYLSASQDGSIKAMVIPL